MTQETPIAAAEEGISLLDLFGVIAENLRLLIVAPIAAGLIALSITYAIPPTFTAKVRFLPPQQQQSAAASMIASLGVLSNLAGAASGLKNPTDQFIAFLNSPTVQNVLIDRFGLMARYDAKLREDARHELSINVRATAGRDGLIAVEVDDKDPKFAAELANAHVEELQKLLGRMAVTEAQQRRVFFENQLVQTKDNLAKAEVALKSTGIDANVLKSSPQAAVESVARIKAAITAQEVKIGAMRGYLTENAPDFKQAMLELSALRGQLAKVEANEPAAGKNGAGSNDFVAKFRDFKYQETLFELFAKQFEIAKIDEAREGATIQVLDVAQPPEKKSKPKRAVVASLTSIITGLALLVYVFARNTLRLAAKDLQSSEKIAAIRRSIKKAIGLA